MKSVKTECVALEAVAGCPVFEDLTQSYDKILAAIKQAAQVFSGQHLMKCS